MFALASTKHPIRRRLWKAGGGVAVFLAVVIIATIIGVVRTPGHTLSYGHDLLPSYTAGQFVREGRPRAMYDLEAVRAFEQKIIREADLDMDGRTGPWLNPPFYALPFAPLSTLPYRTASLVFLAINLSLLAASLLLLARMVRPFDSPMLAQGRPAPSSTLHSSLCTLHSSNPLTCLLVPFLVLLTHPLWQALCHQQNTFLSLLLLSATVTCWRRGAAFFAGLICGLLFFKPQLAALVAAALVVTTGWRALAGLAITGSALLIVTLVTLPGCLGDFLHRLPPILHWLQNETSYNWGRQITFQSAWRLLLEGHHRGETHGLARALWWTCSGAIGASVALMVLRNVRRGITGVSRDRLIAAVIASMPLVMPYYMDYDLLLLSIPAVLFAAEWIGSPESIRRVDRWLMWAWIALFFEAHLNPTLAGHSRFDLAVPVVALVAGLHLARCFRRVVSVETGVGEAVNLAMAA